VGIPPRRAKRHAQEGGLAKQRANRIPHSLSFWKEKAGIVVTQYLDRLSAIMDIGVSQERGKDKNSPNVSTEKVDIERSRKGCLPSKWELKQKDIR